MTIEGIPEGWEAVEFDHSVFGDNWIDEVGDIHFHETDTPSKYKRLIVRKKPPKPKQYRPFANAEEFEPHRDRWVTRKDKSDKEAQPGVFLVAAYDDVGYCCSGGVHERFDIAFSHGRCFDDDGTPFGVRVDGN